MISFASIPTTLPWNPMKPIQETKHSYTNRLNQLRQFSYEDLSEKNQLTYLLLEDYYLASLESCDYTFMSEPLLYTGIHTQLPILLAEFQLDSKSDVETYLELLSALPEYYALFWSWSRRNQMLVYL